MGFFSGVVPVLCGIMLIVLTACGQNPMIGTWRSDQGQTWTFDSNSVKSNSPQLAGQTLTNQTLKIIYKVSPGFVQVIPAPNGYPISFHVMDADNVNYVDPFLGTVVLHRLK